MEKGFYHPERGYWQTTGDVPQKVKAAYPEGTVEVPVQPSPLHTFDGSKWKLDATKDKAVKDAKDAKDAKAVEGQAAAGRVRGTATEADFIAAVQWAMKQ